jgi:2-polyprenyl-3-methyl-5-hydroxy-6-metoxy-1,4-benzoquinol methylase
LPSLRTDCASGVHLREQASLYPGIRFTGIDFSTSEIEAGLKEIEAQALTNIELIAADLREIELEPETYDLILCHGVFSWVTDDVKDRIFQLCRSGLKRDGIAAVAYLTYPGWKQREALRELIGMRVRDVQEPPKRLHEAALLLRFLYAGYAAHEHSPHAQSLRAVVESMQKGSANVFLHDDLGTEHDPCYFMQFVEWAGECGLQYLAETDLATMSAEGIPASAGALLQEIAPTFSRRNSSSTLWSIARDVRRCSFVTTLP